MQQYVIVYYIILHEKLEVRADTDRPNAMSMLRAVRHEPGLSSLLLPDKSSVADLIQDLGPETLEVVHRIAIRSHELSN